MDAEFFSQLEESLSNIGSTECWKREIGGRTIWFSPITFTGQNKIQDSIVNGEYGANTINESKRITLSHAIVGIDETDLRSYRHLGSVFGPIQDPRDPKRKMIMDLPGYIYYKMSAWGSQTVNDAFTVFADLMETHEKNNVKNIKFENSKNPAEELSELMVRVVELRAQLSLPHLVEVPTEVDEVKEFEKSERSKFTTPDHESPEPEMDPEPEVFDPFQRVAAKESNPHAMNEVQHVAPKPNSTMPIPVLERVQNQINDSNAEIDLEGNMKTQSTQNQPFRPQPQDDVIEQPFQKLNVKAPIIDPVMSNINPRFQPPTR